MDRALQPFDPIKRLKNAMMRGDVAFALGLMAILTVLILPMPKMFLDMSLAISLTFSVLVLMTVLFIEKPLEFSSFPTILLVSTMLRLALNVASTRLILSNGHEGTDAAGQVIKAFGSFVMSGNFVIGIIVFTILVIVNFVVITKGSGRIAEVSARFTLDSMPGKQMAIDADLSAGLINDEQAKTRRKNLEDESNFYGAMDGAAKFVRGDAIAGILITFINIVGGIIIGVVQNGLPLYQAAQSYTLLTVGDGLISQIPALIVSTAAGMLASKGSVEGSTEKAFFGQLSAYPLALGLSSFLMFIMAILPGIPMIPFLSLSMLTGYWAYKLIRKEDAVKENAVRVSQETSRKEKEAAVDEPIQKSLSIDLIRLELGYALLPLANAEKGKRLTDQIKAMRKQIATEVGFVMPSVRIQDNLELPANSYVIRVKEIEAGKGEIRPNMLLVMDPTGKQITIPGEDTVEPAFGLKAKWISNTARDEAERLHLTVVDPSTVVTTHLTEVIRESMSELFSYDELEKLIKDLDDSHQKLVAEMIPAQIPMTSLQRVLQNLLSERISIRDLPTILEAVSEVAATTRSVNLISEHVRTRLARQITYANINEEGILPLISLSADWESAFHESVVGDEHNRQLAMAPSKLQEFIEACKRTFEEASMMGEAPVLLTTPLIRPFVRMVAERFRPLTVVMSQNEVHSRVKIKTVGVV